MYHTVITGILQAIYIFVKDGKQGILKYILKNVL
jgi:hypothetical protein